MQNVFKDFNKKSMTEATRERVLGKKKTKSKPNQPTNQNLQKHRSNQTLISQIPKHYKFLKCHHSLHNEIRV